MKLCGFDIGLDRPFFLIAGPCVIESPTLTQEIAGRMKEITTRLGIPFTAVLGLIRSHVAAEIPCRHCGHRPSSPLARLNAAILALPRHRQGRQRTSGRTAAERRTRHTEEVTYTIEITKSNLPEWDVSPKT